MDNILSWIVFLPLIGTALLLMLPKGKDTAVKGISLVFTGLPLVLATMVYFGQFDTGREGYQLVERLSAGVQL